MRGYFVGASAQGDYLSTEYNFRINDIVTWTNGRHTLKFGASVPHMNRRAFDDNTNALGTYTFGPTLNANGSVAQTALDNYTSDLPSGFSQNTGDVHFIYHQQEMGAFIQDQFKMNARFSITPGLRYDWQNFLADKRLGFAPRVSFAWVVDEDSKTVVRGGGGIYYDRFGSGPLLDLARYEIPRRQAIQISLNPADLPPAGCVPITQCTVLTEQPANLARLAPNAAIPYEIQYGLSIERQLGEKATGVISAYSARGIHEFRSVDINAPTPASGYTVRPDPNFGLIRQMQPYGLFEGSGLDVSYRGRLNKYFTGFGRYTWSHYESNTAGLGGFRKINTRRTTSGQTPVLTGAIGWACTPCSIPRACTILRPASLRTRYARRSRPERTLRRFPVQHAAGWGGRATPRPRHRMSTWTCAGDMILRSRRTRMRMRRG